MLQKMLQQRNIALRIPLCYNSASNSAGGETMVGENIKRLREAKNISQSEIAEKLSVTRQAAESASARYLRW